MNEKPKQDPNLSAPQEANTTKHINFMEDTDDTSSSSVDKDASEEDSPTQKAWKELRDEENKQN